MIVILTIIKGEDEGRTFRITDDETKVIGRSSRSGIVLRDVGVSRQHCRIRVDGGACYLADLGSRNGTSINGSRIANEVSLAADDVVELGTTRFGVGIESGSPVEKIVPKVEPVRTVAPDPWASRPGAGLSPPPQAPSRATEPPSRTPVPSTLHFVPRLSVEGRSQNRTGEETADSVTATPGRGEDRGAAQSAERATARAPLHLGPAPRELAGIVIGGCRVEELVDQDDISHIYRATQVSMERAVTLKILRPEMMADQRAIERFVAAARAGGKLSHPNIVQVYDAGEEGGTYFIALEFVGGLSVRQLLAERGRNGALDLRQALQIGEQIAGALDYAHSQSLVHGEVNPNNILVTPHGIAKLASLGFAKSLADSGVPRRAACAERAFEIHYVAPETLDPLRVNLQGEPFGPATAQSDIYSLGAVLFAMVTGQTPFQGASEKEVREKVRRGKRERLLGLPRGAPEELAHVIDRAMARRPADRFGRALDLQAALQQAQERLQPGF